MYQNMVVNFPEMLTKFYIAHEVHILAVLLNLDENISYHDVL